MSNGVIITLDAGHGKGYNTVRFKKPPYEEELVYSEGTTMFEYSLILKSELKKRGYTVCLTREKVEDDPTLTQRGKIAGENHSDLFVSLHSNAKDNDPTKKGIVVIYSMADKEWLKPLAWKIAEADSAVMGSGIVDCYWSESKAYPGEDYFGVLRSAVRYGCKHSLIVEHGYHSYFGDAKFLSSEENLKKLAAAEAEAIDKYLREKIKVYRVQVGAYFVKSNAEKALEKLKSEGHKDAYIVEGDLA